MTLLALGVLVLSAGGGARIPENLAYEPAPAAVGAPAAPQANTLSRGAERKQVRTGVVDAGWARTTGAAVGIPAAALTAYASAELRIDKEQPGCRLSWNTLAGIGWVESHHGTIGDRTLLADGTSSTPILGPALNGQGFAAIRPTQEFVQWHGDAEWEHAVGPLQFIGSTWERWGADGDGDGVENPLDLDDAALAAARYLCADSHNLSTAEGWNRAVHSYNHDNTYVVNVFNAANTYAQRAAG